MDLSSCMHYFVVLYWLNCGLCTECQFLVVLYNSNFIWEVPNNLVVEKYLNNLHQNYAHISNGHTTFRGRWLHMNNLWLHIRWLHMPNAFCSCYFRSINYSSSEHSFCPTFVSELLSFSKIALFECSIGTFIMGCY